MRIHDTRTMRRLAMLAILVAPGAPWLSGPRAGESAAGEGEPRVVEVVAQRFAFEPSTIDATVGERLRLVIRSDDGVHGFALRSFNVTRTIPRGGEPVIIDLTPAAAGEFPFLCSEYCGAGHDDMRGMLRVRVAGGEGR
jgi:cytochrome c oxidase subunit II